MKQTLTDLHVVHVQANDDVTLQTIREQAQSIRAQTGKGLSSITVISSSDDQPSGCVVKAISSKVSVYLLVKGRVDIDEEIGKAQTKAQKAAQGIGKLQKTLNDPKYREKTPKELQEAEEQRLRDLEAERSDYEESIRQFEKLRME